LAFSVTAPAVRAAVGCQQRAGMVRPHGDRREVVRKGNRSRLVHVVRLGAVSALPRGAEAPAENNAGGSFKGASVIDAEAQPREGVPTDNGDRLVGRVAIAGAELTDAIVPPAVRSAA
jgi:hypothetical protein